MAEVQGAMVAKVALFMAILLVLLGVAIDNANVGWLLAAPVTVLVFFAMSRVPLRYSLLGIMFCVFTLENPNEVPANGVWRSPIYVVGAMMLTHLNQTTNVSWMAFSGVDVLLLFVIFRAWQQQRNRRRGPGAPLPTPRSLIQLSWLSLLGTAFVWARGMLRGGDFQKSLWQIEKVYYLPIVFLLFQVAIRGPQDFPEIGKVVLVAAFFRAIMAIYVMNFADTGGVEPPWATTHHDSMLFAGATVILVSLLIHRAHRSARKLTLLMAPVLVWGMVANSRRMVWVQILLVFVTLYFVTPASPVKARIKKWALRLSPIIILYVGLGWHSANPLFKPVQTIRSVIEPANDVSTMTRDIENYDVAQTIRSFPFLGLGYGHGYFAQIALPPMPYPLEPYLPHNSLLGLWFASGFVGYTAMTLLWTAGVYFGVRAYRASSRPIDRATALVCFGNVLIYLIQCYGDIGLGAGTGVYLVAASVAVAGKLAIATGAWPVKEPVGRPRAGASPPAAA
jgi:hypothetical protein